MDGGPRRRSDWWRGHEEQGAVWTGGVRRVQSKCWRDTGERLDPIAVVELISRKICIKVILQKLLYAAGLAVVADGEANLQEQLIA